MDSIVQPQLICDLREQCDGISKYCILSTYHRCKLLSNGSLPIRVKDSYIDVLIFKHEQGSRAMIKYLHYDKTIIFEL